MHKILLNLWILFSAFAEIFAYGVVSFLIVMVLWFAFSFILPESSTIMVFGFYFTEYGGWLVAGLLFAIFRVNKIGISKWLEEAISNYMKMTNNDQNIDYVRFIDTQHPGINEIRDEYFSEFSNSFFDDRFWENVKKNDTISCAYISSFFTVIQSRCFNIEGEKLPDQETIKILFKCLKKKFSEINSLEEFSAIVHECNFKCAIKGTFPFVRTKIRKHFLVFEQLYILYESKYSPPLR